MRVDGGTIGVRHDGAGDLNGRIAPGREVNADDTSEGLRRVHISSDGREFGTGLDRRSDDVFGDMLAVRIAGFDACTMRVEGIVVVGASRLLCNLRVRDPSVLTGEIATWVKRVGGTIAHASESGEFVRFARVAVADFHGSATDATDTEVGLARDVGWIAS